MSTVAWLIGSDWIDHRFGNAAWIAFTFGFLVLVVLGLLALAWKYFVCPVCRQPFRRGSIGRKCEECGTTFDV